MPVWNRIQQPVPFPQTVEVRNWRSRGWLSRLSRVTLAVTFLVAVQSIASAQEKSLAEQMPRIPPQSPADAPKTFKLQNGFSLELVASEPDVVDPIDAAFDERGRMYVVEMNDYPFLPEQREQKYRDQRAETWGRIRLLTDTDNDGKMDHSVIFADKLRWPQSVVCYKGGIFVLSAPNLYYLKDTDGDGVADLKSVVCSGFATANVQGLANGLEWGRDNAIYFSSGMAGGELTIPARNGKPERKFTPGRRDLRLNPETLELTMVSGGQQYGHTINDWGDRFICNNSNHIIHVTWPLPYLERNPLLTTPDLTRSIAKDGAAAVVFRASTPEPWRLIRTARRAADPEMRKRLPQSELVPTGFFTSATGITVYRGGAYPPEYQGDVFIGDCGGNLIHRKKLTPDGISFTADRADQGVEFMTSTDNWYRPVNFVNAPDGTLYVLDMYRETIEHPISIPDDIKANVDLESGYDKGRIWRLIPPNYKRTPPPNLEKLTTGELVQTLKSPHGALRDVAQRLLVERQDVAAVTGLREILRDKSGRSTPQSKIHALWTLSGLKKLEPDDVRTALSDSSEFVREHALKTLPQVIAKAPELTELALSLTNDKAPRVVWQLAFTLGDLPEKQAVLGLRSLASRAASDSDLRVAWLSSSNGLAPSLVKELFSEDTIAVRPLLVELARVIGSSPDSSDQTDLLRLALKESTPLETRMPVLLALGDGLKRRGTAIEKVLIDGKADRDLTLAVAKMFERASETAKNSAASESERLAAVRALALTKAEQATSALVELLAPQVSPDLQLAAVKALSGQATEEAFKALIDSWKGFGLLTRKEVIDNLVQSNDGATTLLSAVESGTIKPSELDRDKRQLLSNYPNPAVKEMAKKVLAETPSNRKEVVANYQPATELTGDATRGKTLLAKTCLQCHRMGATGHQVGPDFASVQNKSPADLIIAILDPNREALPQYQTYTAVTKQGQIHTGLIASETSASLTLKRAEAKEDIILRETLDELVSNGASLMPEGLEKDIDKQQLADIIAAIKQGP